MPVVAGGLVSCAVLVPLLPLVKISASTMTTKTAPAIHPHGVGEAILRSISIRSKSLGSVIAASSVRLSRNRKLGNRHWFPRAEPASSADSSGLRFGNCGLQAVEDQLRLRHDRGELAIAAGDPGLEHDGGAAAMERHAYGARDIALRHRGKKIGLALDRRGAAALGQADTRGHPAQRI